MTIERRRFLLGSSAVALAAAALALPVFAPSAGAQSVVELMAPDVLPDMVMGDADAPVTIIEYASMTCPHCAAFHETTLPVIKEKLRGGGLLIIDNMLWSGRLFDEQDASPATEGVREFTKQITTDSDWIVSLAPMRDGMIVAYKK